MMITKRNFYSILFLAALSLLLVSGCVSANQAAPTLSMTPINSAPVTQSGEVSIPETGNVHTPTLVVASPTTVVTPTTVVSPTVAATPIPVVSLTGKPAEVAIDNLNLRLGPGFNYSVLKLLQKGQELSMEGRSNDELWILVKLADGSEGWVFNSYLLSDADITSLPVKEAYGGPNGPTPVQELSYSVLASIEDNIATVNVAKYPQNEKIIARLGLPGEELDLDVAKGKTDSHGNAQLTFEMPSRWSDGSRVKQSELVLEVSTADGTYSHEITVVYIHY